MPIHFEEFLVPISETHPGGEFPLSASVEETLEDLKSSGRWDQVLAISMEHLKSTSKDLDAALWFTQAAVYLNGFEGLDDSLGLVLELIGRFWDLGLHPLDSSHRAVSLRWLNVDLAELLRHQHLTQPKDAGCGLTLKQFKEAQELEKNTAAIKRAVTDEARAPLEQHLKRRLESGWTTPSQWSKSVEDTTSEFYAQLRRQILGVISSHSKIAQIVGQRVDGSRRFDNASEVLLEINALVESIERPRSSDPTHVPTSEKSISADLKQELNGTSAALSVDEQLKEIHASVMIEPTGRDRFIRKLAVAKLYLPEDRTLAQIILEDLAREIDDRRLVEWERLDVVADVWKLLYECRRRANDADGAKNLLNRLCQLTPWEALSAERLRPV